MSVMQLETLAELERITERARVLVAAVPDPEIPVINIEELGVLRDVKAVPFCGGHVIEVTITPTYSACPAIEQIKDDILAELDAHDIPARVRTVLAPAWTTDWLSDAAKEKLRAYGIAPPGRSAQRMPLLRRINGDPVSSTDTLISIATDSINSVTRSQFDSKKSPNMAAEVVNCPRCTSIDTVEISFFGSTACKSQMRCLSCREPFDHFKPY